MTHTCNNEEELSHADAQMLPDPEAISAPAPAPENPARELLRQWAGVGIPYCTLRDRPGPEPETGDLDLLVAESFVPRCRDWLEQRGFVAGPNRSPFKMVFLRYREGRTLCLDIHWKAVQYGIVYMDARRMLARRVESDGVFHLSPEDELLHLVVHNFLRKGQLRPAALERIRHLLRAPIDRAYLRDHLDSFGLTPSFEAAARWIARCDVTDPNTSEAAALRRRVLWSAIRARPGNALRYLRVRHLAGTRRRRRGGLVVLIGPDGSGKSTVIKALRHRARAIPSLVVDTTYLGPWGQMQLALVPAFRRAGITPVVQPFGLRSREGGLPGPGEPARRRTIPGSAGHWLSSLTKGYLFYGAIYIELLHRYVTSVFFNVRKGHWVVADRYITDLRYAYKERPIRNYGIARRLLCRFFPKPDLLIVLDNRPDVVASRKSGLAVGQIETLRSFCLKAARAYRYEIVTTDHSPDEIADHLLNRMLALRALR